MKSRKKTKKRKSSPSVLLAACLLAAFTLTAEEKPAAKGQAILAGSVHDQPSGLAIPGIRIEIRRQGEKKPRWRAVTDVRGDFAVRVPAGQASYVIATASKEHVNQEIAVEVVSHERVEVLFLLKPVVAPGGKP